jgi:hypothetical protein
MPEGWRRWLEWQREVAPDNAAEIETVEADAGKWLGYLRVVGRRRADVELDSYCWPDGLKASPVEYAMVPLLRADAVA